MKDFNEMTGEELCAAVRDLALEVASRTPPFERKPWYNKYGDCLSYTKADVATIHEWVDDYLSILRGADGREIVGVELNGVSTYLRDPANLTEPSATDMAAAERLIQRVQRQWDRINAECGDTKGGAA